ncbi:MAG: ABC transporter substrate-binding protein [Promethearchaeota archaeon]
MKDRKTLFKVITLFLALTLLGNIAMMVTAQDELEPFFSCHLLAPTNNPVRMQYAQLLETEFSKIGVDVELDLVAWSAMGPRCYYDEAGTYLEGGYDMVCMGMSIGTPASHPGNSMLGIYHNDAVPPFGYNVAMWSNRSTEYNDYRAGEASDLIDALNQELDFDEAKKQLIDWQKIHYDAMPQTYVLVQSEVHAVSTGLYGYDPTGYPIASAEDQWLTDDYVGAAGKVVLGTSDSGTRFYDFLGKSVYDQYTSAPVQDALVGNTPSSEMIIPTGVDRETWMDEHYHNRYATTGYLERYPRVAEAMGTYSSDGLKYTISIRDDVYWHDGIQVDAWDVAFGFQAELQPDAGSSTYSTLKTEFGLDDKENNHGNYSFVVTDDDDDGFDETIEFNFAAIYAPFVLADLGLSIKPEHILGDPDNHGFNPTTGDFEVSRWLVQPSNWVTHSMNTANPEDTGGYKGPIGCGSMVFYNRDPTSKVVTLKKFDGIRWDTATSKWVDDPDLRHYLAEDGLLDDMPDEYTMVQGDMNSIVADAKEGDVNLIDPQFTMAPILTELQEHEKITAVLSTESGWQCLYFNPKYADADGVHHLKNKGVRHGLSHAIPREDIVEYLLAGQGVPGYTAVPITNWGAAPPADFLEYKKTIKATDGTTPEADETTHYDSYDLDLALDWFETEGYEVQPFRDALAAEGGGAPGFGIIVGLIACVGAAAYLRKKNR